MDASAGTGRSGALSDYLAAERTLLAWIRNGLALMGFGFVVARFGLFLQQLQVTERAPTAQSYGLSLWFGTALIAVGVVVSAFSGWRHARSVRELDRGEVQHSRPSTEAVAMAFLLALIGLAMAIYLVSVRSSAHSGIEIGMEASMTSTADNGIVDTPTNHSVDEVVERLKGLLRYKETPSSPWSTIAVKRRKRG
jgi:putative membrane protein